MKILLDESLPRKLKNDFGADHEVLTVREQGWLGKKNGELLTLMSESKFDLFITVDRNPTISAKSRTSFHNNFCALCG